MIATVRFEGGELDLVLASLISYTKENPDQKSETNKLITKLHKIKRART